MLKSTHRQTDVVRDDKLPTGWSEHRAPTGHTYYYNAETKQSTYTRPIQPSEESELLIDYGATAPDREMKASLTAMQEFQKNSTLIQAVPGADGVPHRGSPAFRPNKQGDRAKSKTAIVDCAPWVLVRTKYGRRFVHNTETKESYWKFPSAVMMAVIDMDRMEWEKQSKIAEEKLKAKGVATNGQANASNNDHPSHEPYPADYNSDEYEEVEVTDDEADAGDDHTAKKPRVDHTPNTLENPQTTSGPQEFDEDDIAWQLAQLEAEDEDPGYDFNLEGEDGDEEGLPLTREDREALFRQLLDEHYISPFSTFDALIDTNTSTANAVISDDRWTALSNMASRRVAFDAWSRDRVAARHADKGQTTENGQASSIQSSKQQKLDPRVAYLRFLGREATVQL